MSLLGGRKVSEGGECCWREKWGFRDEEGEKVGRKAQA
jgi:hypothetical protein